MRCVDVVLMRTSYPPSQPPQACAARGFTLIELLVALALLGLVALGLGSALVTIAQTQERVDQRIDRFDRQDSAVRFLRLVLSQTSGLRRPADQVGPGESQLYFNAQPQLLEWLGNMPANFGAGGRTHFRLGLADAGGQGSQLVLQFIPWQPDQPLPDWDNAGSYVLETEVSGLQLSYQRLHRQHGQQWLEEWLANTPETQGLETELPSAIRLQVQSARGDWPVLVVQVLQPMGGAARREHVIGGSR